MAWLDLKYLLIMVWIFATIDSVECLMCIRCSSLFDRECISGQMAPKNCSMNSKYCTKYEGTVKFSGDKFVTRDCDVEKDKLGCRDMKFDDKEVKVCYTVCKTDGCNGASSTYSLHWIVYIISSLYLKFSLQNF